MKHNIKCSTSRTYTLGDLFFRYGTSEAEILQFSQDNGPNYPTRVDLLQAAVDYVITEKHHGPKLDLRGKDKNLETELLDLLKGSYYNLQSYYYIAIRTPKGLELINHPNEYGMNAGRSIMAICPIYFMIDPRYCPKR